MTCKSCGAANPREFVAEIAIHFPGLKGIDLPTICVFPKLLVCLNCGVAEFAISEAQIASLAITAAGGGAD